MDLLRGDLINDSMHDCKPMGFALEVNETALILQIL
jgi:hypothetical protein